MAASSSPKTKKKRSKGKKRGNIIAKEIVYSSRGEAQRVAFGLSQKQVLRILKNGKRVPAYHERDAVFRERLGENPVTILLNRENSDLHIIVNILKLHSKLSFTEELVFSTHAHERMEKRRVTETEVRLALTKGKIVSLSKDTQTKIQQQNLIVLVSQLALPNVVITVWRDGDEEY